MKGAPGLRAPVVAAVLLTVAVLSFPGVLRSDRVFYQRDVGAYWYPQVATLRAVMASGAWPVWDPYEGFGTPLLGDPGSQVLYPASWPSLVLPPALHFKLFTLAHVALSGLGLFLLARRLGLDAGPSLTAAFAWQVSGAFLSLVSMHHLASAAWVPWVLLALERMLAAPTPRNVAVLGAAAALQSLGGSADMCLATALLGGGRLLLEPRARSRAHLLGLAAAGLLALGLAAPLWFTAAGVLLRSSRSAMGAASLYWSVHPLSLVDLAALRLVSDAPLHPSVRLELFEGREPLLGTLHLGPPLLALALLGALSGRRARWVALGLAVLVLMALGKHGPAAHLLTLPPFSFVRYPSKYLVPASFVLALLAGAGAQAWARGTRSRSGLTAMLLLVGSASAIAAAAWAARHPAIVLAWLAPPLPGLGPEQALVQPLVVRLSRVAALTALTGLVFALRASARPRWTTPVLALMVAASGLVGARAANSLGAPGILDRPAIVSSIPSGRVLALPRPAMALMAELPREDTEELFARNAQECLVPPTSARWGLRGSYDGDPTLLGDPALGLASATLRQVWGSLFALRLLQVGSVEHVVACDDVDPGGLELLREVAPVGPRPVRLLRVPAPLPRVYSVSGVRTVRDVDGAWHALGARDFDPWREVVVLGAPGLEHAREAPAAAVTVLQERADLLRVAVRAASDQMVVVTEAWTPAWRATVDGQPADVVRANVLFRATRVPAGEHEVEWRYRPRETPWGVAAFAAALAALGLMARRAAL